MSSTNRAAELRALADHYDTIGALEEAAAGAKQALRDAPEDTEAQTAHKAATVALRDARAEGRSSGILVASSEPGSVTIAPAGIQGKAEVA